MSFYHTEEGLGKRLGGGKVSGEAVAESRNERPFAHPVASRFSVESVRRAGGLIEGSAAPNCPPEQTGASLTTLERQ